MKQDIVVFSQNLEESQQVKCLGLGIFYDGE